ncbi:MAG: class I SAM-dependent methyltransferase [Acidimicrobiales bacterium]
MRADVFNFVAEAAKKLTLQGPVIEVGARPAEGQEDLTDLRSLFPGQDYVGCDIQPGPRVDQVEDIHHLSFEDGSIGTALALDTLEHVRDPIRAVGEMHRVLAPGGCLLISSVMFFPIHAHPWDYWRFTPEGFAELLAPFPSSVVLSIGWEFMPETVLGIGVKQPGVKLDADVFPETAQRAGEWGRGLRVDLGPIRLSARQSLSIAFKASLDAAKARASRLGRSFNSR